MVSALTTGPCQDNIIGEDTGERERGVTMETVVKEMHDEFKKRSKILLSGLPSSSIISEQDIKSLLSPSLHDFIIVSKVTSDHVRLLFPSAPSANEAIKQLDGCKYKGHTLSCNYGHPDSLIFVGNFSKWYTRDKLHELFSPIGKIIRCLVVYSTQTGDSKCYGFVEFATREEAMLAKQCMAMKSLNGRSLRVDFADNGMQTCEDLQSCTLFVDRLPKTLKSVERLKQNFDKYGTVNFCQIAFTSSGASRCFAFLDFGTSESAEDAQSHCNGITIDGQEIRVSYGMPCRPGACILQPKCPQTNNAVGRKSIPMVCFPQDNIIVSSSNTLTVFHSVNIPPHLFLPNNGPFTVPGKIEEQHSKPSIAGHKRSMTDRSSPPFIYDRPFIGQHDQGIVYTHPLKRICASTMS